MRKNEYCRVVLKYFGNCMPKECIQSRREIKKKLESKVTKKKWKRVQIKLQLPSSRWSYKSVKHKGEQPPSDVVNMYVNIYVHISRWTTIFCRSVGLCVYLSNFDPLTSKTMKTTNSKLWFMEGKEHENSATAAATTAE